MMCRCKPCLSLIHLFLPLSLSCTPSFRTVTYGRQLCREPQSVPSVLTAYQDGEISTPSPFLAYQKPYIFRWSRPLCRVTAPHTSVFGSPQVAQISEKMSTLPTTMTKCRLTEGIRRPRHPDPALLTEQACW
ncbi:hypothetical protein NQZ68_022706 [Dissostichus eleginoides]|nr:hypothetical protein NQZ68_022706 [Dissostichus eleginoides]